MRRHHAGIGSSVMTFGIGPESPDSGVCVRAVFYRTLPSICARLTRSSAPTTVSPFNRCRA